MKRIIFDCERMKHENTGLYHYCLNLGNHLSKFTAPGMEALTLYSPPEKNTCLAKTRITSHKLNFIKYGCQH
ncbi:MAG: hypothetical protein IPH68_08755 [Chitinophagaceae bacterium]|nr:hypothetical protein [Chitinophagaceae bacterium]